MKDINIRKIEKQAELIEILDRYFVAKTRPTFNELIESEKLKSEIAVLKEQPEEQVTVTDEEIRDFCKQFKPKSQQGNLRFAIGWLRDKYLNK